MVPALRRTCLFKSGKMKFNSQIHTDPEQSCRLLDMGMNPETADCEIVSSLPMNDGSGSANITIAGAAMCRYTIPAWSLGRLLEMLPSVSMPSGSGWRLSAGGCRWSGMYYGADGGNVYDHVIGLMEWLIRMDYFCEDYLMKNR